MMKLIADALSISMQSGATNDASKTGRVHSMAMAKVIAAIDESRKQAKNILLLDGLGLSITIIFICKQLSLETAFKYLSICMSLFQSNCIYKNRREFIQLELISRHLKCSICQDVFQDPVRTICGHTFCYLCIQNWAGVNKSCPLCKKSIRKRSLEKDLIASGVIDDLPARCLHINCHYAGAYSAVKKHQHYCVFRPLKTVISGGQVVVVDDLESSSENIIEVVHLDKDQLQNQKISD